MDPIWHTSWVKVIREIAIISIIKAKPAHLRELKVNISGYLEDRRVSEGRETVLFAKPSPDFVSLAKSHVAYSDSHLG